MGLWKTIVLAGAVFALNPHTARSQDQAVSDTLASMVEDVVRQTSLSITISRSTPVSVSISHINGQAVCEPRARPDVEKLQRAFDADPRIYRNIGPVLITFTDRSGRKTQGDRSELERKGILKGCTQIYVSVHE